MNHETREEENGLDEPRKPPHSDHGGDAATATTATTAAFYCLGVCWRTRNANLPPCRPSMPGRALLRRGG